jgi:hypothetical protein
MDDEKPQFTSQEVTDLRAMLVNFQHSKWLVRILWKVSIWVGATVAGVAAFKDNLIDLLNLRGH